MKGKDTPLSSVVQRSKEQRIHTVGYFLSISVVIVLLQYYVTLSSYYNFILDITTINRIYLNNSNIFKLFKLILNIIMIKNIR